MKKYPVQQGDVFIEKTTKIPLNAKSVVPKNRGHILADGEVTGHAHVIADVGSVEMFESDETLYMNVLKECDLVHEEHGMISIDPGIYTVRRVREYDHFAEEARAVKD